MALVTAAAQGHVDAPADLVLEIIRDFDGHHRHILPAAFSDFRVVKGGTGAGTVTSFVMTLGGKARPGRTVASEPEPGVVREDVEGTDMVTHFRVSDEAGGAHVEITTSWTPSGLGERLFAPAMLSRVYRQEVRLIADYAASIYLYRTAAIASA